MVHVVFCINLKPQISGNASSRFRTATFSNKMGFLTASIATMRCGVPHAPVAGNPSPDAASPPCSESFTPSISSAHSVSSNSTKAPSKSKKTSPTVTVASTDYSGETHNQPSSLMYKQIFKRYVGMISFSPFQSEYEKQMILNLPLSFNE